jgi:hypothetical protein
MSKMVPRMVDWSTTKVGQLLIELHPGPKKLYEKPKRQGNGCDFLAPGIGWFSSC